MIELQSLDNGWRYRRIYKNAVNLMKCHNHMED